MSFHFIFISIAKDLSASVCLSVCHTRQPRLRGSRYHTIQLSDASSFVMLYFMLLTLAIHSEEVW